MIEPIISGAFFILAFIAAFLGFLFGMRKKWQYTLLKIATTVLAAIAAIIVARAIPAQGTEALINMLVGLVPEALAPDVESILNAPEISGSILALISMALSPLLFSLVFIIVKPVLGIFKAPIARFWINKAEKNKTWNNNRFNYDKWGKKKLLEHRKFRMSSALLGAFSGVLLVYTISIPTVFGLSITGKIAKPIVENFAGEDTTLVEICDAAIDNRVVTSMELTGGKAVYNLLTYYEINGEFTHLDKEMNFLATSIRAVSDLVKTDGYDGAATKEAIDEMAAAFDKTLIMPSIMSGVLHVSDTKWDNGETFLGMNRPSLPEPFTPITDSIFEILSGDDVNALKADIGSIFKITGVMAEKIRPAAIFEDPLSVLSDKETNSKIFEELYTSDRLYTLVPAFADAGVGVMIETLHFHKDAASNYTNMEEAILTATQDAAINGGSGELADKLHDILNSYGIDAKETSCAVLARALINQNSSSEITLDAVTEILGATEIVIVEADETTESTITLTAETFAEKTQLVFADSIKINYDKPADTKRESDLLAESFVTIRQVADKALAGEELDPKTIVVDFGRLIDCLNATHTFGAESSKNLLICVLQSDYALETLRTDTIAVTHLARSIADTAKGESYANVLENIIRAIDILDGASSNQDVVDQIQDLIINMTPATSTTLQQFTSPDNMQNFGIPEQSAEQTSNLVSNIFNNLSDAKENGGLTDEEYKAEAEAVSDIINIAMNATEEGASGDTLFNENQTVTDFVDRITDSKVMGQTIVDTVYDENGNKTVDPLNSTVTLSDADKAELLTAMNNNLANADADSKEETQKTLEAIAALVNVNVEMVNGEFVIPGFSN